MIPETREATRQNRLAAVNSLLARERSDGGGPVTALDALRDARACVTRALEAITDGELGLAEHLLDNLGSDISDDLERLEETDEETPQ